MNGKAQASRRKRRSLKPLLTAMLLLAFSLQSFLVQTHIHAMRLTSQDHAGVTLSTPQRSTTPLDADNCVLCQEYLHSGAYLTPAATAVLPPSAQISILPLIVAPIAVAREVSHIWMGRAPPRA